MKLFCGFQNTKENKEDFALTPYLFLVWVNVKKSKVRGIGICWGYFAFYIAYGYHIPYVKNYFFNHTKTKTS